MSEIRYNRLKDTWTIIAEERARRPHDYATHVHEEEVGDVSRCPFEYGNEDKTPPEIFAIREPGTLPNTPGWKIRVVPNKYPAVRIETPPDRIGECLYDKIMGFGAHEVIIDTPDHFKHIQNFSIQDLNNLFLTFKERIVSLSGDTRIRYIHIFKNHGKEAGKSLVHSHSQLIALPIIPKIISTKIEQSRNYYKEKERCLLCDELNQELREVKRVVYENDSFVVYCPYASLFPFEIKIIPKFHSHDFTNINDKQLNDLSDAVQVSVQKLHKTLINPPFNMVLYTSPPVREIPSKMDYFYHIDKFYHWHIEILPRIATLAGFELGTGYYINPTPPEDAAKYLREVIL